MFQYSIGTGVIILFGSLRREKSDVLKNSLKIPITVFMCGILSAIAVFLYVGHLAHLKNLSFHDLELTGAELTFVIFPMALNLMPFTNLWAILFFVMMTCLGIDTMFGYNEYIFATLEEIV